MNRPTVAGARPARCPSCDAPAEASGRMILVGHGARIRRVWGPPWAGRQAEIEAVSQRRYRCRNCCAVVVVRPRGLVGRLRYRAVAVALALFRWGHQRRPGHAVQAEISPAPPGLYALLHGWRQLRRWARAAVRLWPGLRLARADSARDRAAACASQLAASSVQAEAAFIDQICDGAQRA